VPYLSSVYNKLSETECMSVCLISILTLTGEGDRVEILGYV